MDVSRRTGQSGSCGDPGSDFVRQLMQSQNQIYSYILTMVPNWSDAEDILQDTSEILWRKYGQGEKIEYFAALGIKVAQNLIYQYYRQKKQQDRLLTEEAFEDLAAYAGQLSSEADRRVRMLHTCLSKLPGRDMELIRLRYESGYTVRKMAEVTNRSAEGLYKVMGRIHDMILRCVRRGLAMEEV